VFAELLLAATFQIGPFYEQRPADDYLAVRPFYAHEGDVDDVLWPVFTSHRDWWRFCFFLHYQNQDDGGWQFDFIPLWFNGHKPQRGESAAEDYWGLFPIYGHHPHILLMYDIDFALWPVWTRYRMPRPSEGKWLTTNTVLFPFFSWRDDGAWSFWPLYGINHQRESDHQYALWPIVTWANYREDRDTAGEGSSWMVWPLYGQIRRARERQDLFIPPFFSWTETYSKSWAAHGNSAPEMRLRCPWPIFEWESNARRSRLSIWPLYERVDWRSYDKGDAAGSVTRFGWKLVELYDNETRVFPFWTSRKDDSYFRLWPFWETEAMKDGSSKSRLLGLFPMRWVPSVDRNWSKFWTFYEKETNPVCTYHSLLWGIIRWRTVK